MSRQLAYEPGQCSTSTLFASAFHGEEILKRLLSFVTCGLAVIVLGLTLTVSAAIAEPKANEQTFLKLQHDWAEARKNADIPFLENFYAKEFTVGVMTGGESTRAQDLAMFSSGDLKPSVIEDSEIHVSIYGETAMVTALEHLEGIYRGHSGAFDLRFTNVFVHRDGRWQIVRHQAAQVQKR
jgi:ketosteroid isomerase-like protein